MPVKYHKVEHDFQKYFEWYLTPKELRDIPDESKFIESLGMNFKTMVRWRKKAKIKAADPLYENEIYKIRMKVLALSSKGTPKDRENYGRMLGAYEDKQVIKHEYDLSAEAKAKFYNEFLQRLRDALQSGGVCPVCFSSLLLHGEVRTHTDENKPPENGKVAELAIPEGPG